jgi:hypothetical protein
MPQLCRVSRLTGERGSAARGGASQVRTERLGVQGKLEFDEQTTIRCVNSYRSVAVNCLKKHGPGAPRNGNEIVVVRDHSVEWPRPCPRKRENRCPIPGRRPRSPQTNHLPGFPPKVSSRWILCRTLEKGKGYLKPIAEVTDKPVTHVIYSHDHTDHIGAAYLFPRAPFTSRKRRPRAPENSVPQAEVLLGAASTSR